MGHNIQDGTHQRCSKSVVDYHRLRGSGGATGVQDEIRIILGLFKGLVVWIVAGAVCRVEQVMELWYYDVLERRKLVHNVMDVYPDSGQQNCATSLLHERDMHTGTVQQRREQDFVSRLAHSHLQAQLLAFEDLDT